MATFSEDLADGQYSKAEAEPTGPEVIRLNGTQAMGYVLLTREQAELDSLLQEFLMQAFSENAPGLKVGDYVFHPPVKAFVRK